MQSALVRFREYERQASNTERGMIDFLLRNPEKVASMNIRRLSAETYASTSTISRLCNKVGFRNYREFQQVLLYENAIRKEENKDYAKEIELEDSLEQIVEKVIYRSVVSLEDTKNLIDVKILDACIKKIRKAERIVFFGVGESHLVGKDAYLKFLRINKTCMICEDFHAQRVLSQTMTPKDFGIVLSYSGMTKEILNCASDLTTNKIPFVAITCFAESKLARLANYNLYISAAEYQLTSGKLGSVISQLVVIDLLYAAYVQSEPENCVRHLRQTYIGKEKQ